MGSRVGWTPARKEQTNKRTNVLSPIVATDGFIGTWPP